MDLSAARLATSYGLWVGGREVAARNAATRRAVSPYDDRSLATIAEASDADADAAVAAAAQSLESPVARLALGRSLLAASHAVRAVAAELAAVEAADSGVPIRFAAERLVPAAANSFRYFAGWADKCEYAAPGTESAGVALVALGGEATGLAAASAVAAALAAGCAVVLKPSRACALSALHLVRAIAPVLPAGRLAVVTGAENIVFPLARHPAIGTVWFAGPASAARAVRRACADRGVPCRTLPSAPRVHLVLEDAPLAQAADAIAFSATRRDLLAPAAGHLALVAEASAHDFRRAVARRLAEERCGDPLDRATDVGVPAANETLARAQEILDAARLDGAEVLRARKPPVRDRTLLPTAFVFGAARAAAADPPEGGTPIVHVETYRSLDEALGIAARLERVPCATIWGGSAADAASLGDALHADAVVHGSLEGAGERFPAGGEAWLQAFRRRT